MKTVNILIALCLVSTFAFSQHEKTLVGEFCYYEQIDGQKTNREAMPYVYHDRLELKFSSEYQISIKDRLGLTKIVKLYSSKTATNKTLLGEYKPETIGKGKSVADVESSIKVFWDGKNIIIEIPELTDAFGGGKASNHAVFIPKNCVADFINCLGK